MNSRKKKSRGTRAFRQPAVMQVDADAMIEDSAPKKEEKDGKPVEDITEDAPAGESAGNTGSGAPASGPEAEEAAAPEKSELETLRGERDAYLDLARRERADFDNYRKRMQREMAEMKRASLGAFLREFFGPLDDMDRVLQESAKSGDAESLIQGVRIMEENFWRALAKAGVTRIDAAGKQFDPGLHEAMAAVPSADAPPNTILEVYENGYRLDDFILRPARVIVSRTPDE